MTVVDSSGWIEFFTGGPLAGAYAKYLKHPQQLITPTVILYEVYKVVKRQRGEEQAIVAAAQLSRTHMAPLTESIALTAADVSLTHQIAMADAIVYATALTQRARLITSDADLGPLPGVTYLQKN